MLIFLSIFTCFTPTIHSEPDKALDEAFEALAQKAGERDFVVIQGLTREFGGEVMNAYSIDGISEDEILPAILISSVNPHRFEEVRSIDKSGPFKPREPVVLISYQATTLKEG